MKEAILLTVIICFGFITMLGEEVPADSLTTPDQHNILIAYTRSAFKEAVIEDLTLQLQQLKATVHVIKTSELKEVAASDYDAVVIMNRIWAWRLESRVNKFLDNLSEEETSRLILLSTAADPDWRCDRENIDEITSASRREDAENISAKILARIKIILAIE